MKTITRLIMRVRPLQGHVPNIHVQPVRTTLRRLLGSRSTSRPSSPTETPYLASPRIVMVREKIPVPNLPSISYLVVLSIIQKPLANVRFVIKGGTKIKVWRSSITAAWMAGGRGSIDDA